MNLNQARDKAQATSRKWAKRISRQLLQAGFDRAEGRHQANTARQPGFYVKAAAYGSNQPTVWVGVTWASRCSLEDLQEELADFNQGSHSMELRDGYAIHRRLVIKVGPPIPVQQPCSHQSYQTRPHPDGGEQPYCPTCEEWVDL